MAEFHRVVTDLTAELSTQIRAIVPRRAVDPRMKFEEIETQENGQSIRDLSPSPRKFQISEPYNITDSSSGGSTSQKNFDIDILFAYPNTKRWASCAVDDLDSIRRYFTVTPSSVVGARFVKNEFAIRSENSPEDNRSFWLLTVSVWADVTY